MRPGSGERPTGGKDCVAEPRLEADRRKTVTQKTVNPRKRQNSEEGNGRCVFRRGVPSQLRVFLTSTPRFRALINSLLAASTTSGGSRGFPAVPLPVHRRIFAFFARRLASAAASAVVAPASLLLLACQSTVFTSKTRTWLNSVRRTSAFLPAQADQNPRHEHTVRGASGW